MICVDNVGDLLELPQLYKKLLANCEKKNQLNGLINVFNKFNQIRLYATISNIESD